MTQEKQLAIRSTEAADLAETLARETGRSKKQLVLEGLRLLEGQRAEGGAVKQSSSARLRWERFQLALQRLQEELREIEETTGEKMTSDHSWMYDEFGLPK